MTHDPAQSLYDAVHLRHVADRQRGHSREDSINPGGESTQGSGDIAHGAVLKSQPLQDLGVFDRHAKQRRGPKPENSARPAHGDSLCRSDNIARPDGSRQSGARRLKRRQSTALLIPPKDRGAQHYAEAAKGQKPASEQKADPAASEKR